MQEIIRQIQRRKNFALKSDKNQQELNTIIQPLMKGKLNIKLRYAKIKLKNVGQQVFNRILFKLSTECRFITMLHLQGNFLSNSTIQLIVKAGWKFIVDFNAKNSRLNDQAISYFILLNWPFLKTLDLSLNPIKNKGISFLAKCKFQRLEQLICKKIAANGQCFKCLIKAQWPKIKQINFCQTKLGVIDFSLLGKISWKCLQFIDLHSKQNNIFLWCGHMSKFPQYLKKTRLYLYSCQTKLNQLKTIQNLSEMFIHANSFCFSWKTEQPSDLEPNGLQIYSDESQDNL